MINPTGKGVRSDPQGDGHFTAPRGWRCHTGVDFVCTPGQQVYAPITGHARRLVRPYSNDDRFSGLEITSDLFIVHVLYIEPFRGLLGKGVKAGDVIGHAQNIVEKYGGSMCPHVHVNVYLNIEKFL